jgi:hypothetical protein
MVSRTLARRGRGKAFRNHQLVEPAEYVNWMVTANADSANADSKEMIKRYSHIRLEAKRRVVAVLDGRMRWLRVRHRLQNYVLPA